MRNTKMGWGEGKSKLKGDREIERELGYYFFFYNIYLTYNIS